MKKRPLLLLLLLITMVTPHLFATYENPVRWKYSVAYKSVDEVILTIKADIEQGWHLYSQYQNGMALPLVLTLTPDSRYSPINNTAYWSEPAYKQVHNEEFNDTERYLVGRVTFTYPIRVHSSKAFNIRGSLEGQGCIEGRCVPLREKFEFSIKHDPTRSTDTTRVHKPDSITATSVGVLIGSDSARQIEVSGNQMPFVDIEPVAEQESLWLFFILAFLGGLLGILTPCVFPMIPMTVSYFIKHEGRRQAIFYGFSIIFIYVVMGIVLSAIFGQGFANFISTHWLPNLLFAAIFILFAFSLFGYFEISLPSWMVNKSASNESRAGYIGTFFMALTLVLVSFSCTLPIVGTVALNAAGGSYLKPIIGMLGFSLAFALPFTFFAIFPGMLQSLPKSGSWMNTIKVCLAFVELAFALKFINVPDQTYHWGLLDREIYLSIWIVLFTMLGFYLLGKLRFPLDGQLAAHVSWGKLSLSIVSFSFVVYMIPGLVGAPLNGLSGWLPPMHTQDFDINKVINQSATIATPSTIDMCEKPLFEDQLSHVTGINGYFDYDQALKCAKQKNKPLFLDFTGHGCVNCRQVEQKVLSHPTIQSLLREEFITATLYVDDKRVQLPESMYVKGDKGSVITMLGPKNAYLQSSLFQQNSQPCYIIIHPDGTILNGPLFFETNINTYEAFLREGVERFKEQK